MEFLRSLGTREKKSSSDGNKTGNRKHDICVTFQPFVFTHDQHMTWYRTFETTFMKRGSVQESTVQPLKIQAAVLYGNKSTRWLHVLHGNPQSISNHHCWKIMKQIQWTENKTIDKFNTKSCGSLFYINIYISKIYIVRGFTHRKIRCFLDSSTKTNSQCCSC